MYEYVRMESNGLLGASRCQVMSTDGEGPAELKEEYEKASRLEFKTQNDAMLSL